MGPLLPLWPAPQQDAPSGHPGSHQDITRSAPIFLYYCSPSPNPEGRRWARSSHSGLPPSRTLPPDTLDPTRISQGQPLFFYIIVRPRPTLRGGAGLAPPTLACPPAGLSLRTPWIPPGYHKVGPHFFFIVPPRSNPCKAWFLA